MTRSKLQQILFTITHVLIYALDLILGADFCKSILRRVARI